MNDRSTMSRRATINSAIAACGVAASGAWAQASNGRIRIAFITDLTGPYADLDGPGGAEAIRMAVADAGGSVGGNAVEVIVGDHKNRAAVATVTAREFFDVWGAHVLIGGVNSGTSLAMAAVAAKRSKPFLVVGAGNTDHTTTLCSPFTVQYAYDTAAQGKVLGSGVTRNGGQSWYTLTPDYAFGEQMCEAMVLGIEANGGRVVGSAKHPSGARDFTDFLETARMSGADVLGLASGHTDLINTVRAARALGTTRTMKLAGTFAFIDEVHALGLEAAQGMYLTESWFWNRDSETRAWSQRFFHRFNRMPSSLQAADYSAASQYLDAVRATNTTDGRAILAHMRTMTINDVFARNGSIRENGLMTHDMYLLRVKAPEASREPWDYYDLVETFRGEEAWLPRQTLVCRR